MITYSNQAFNFSNIQKDQKSHRDQSLFGLSFSLLNPFPKIKEAAIGTLAAFGSIDKKIMNSFLILNSIKEVSIYASQEKIAQMAGCCRQTANKSIKRIASLGYIAKLNRGVKRTCLYKVSKWFDEEFIPDHLAKILPFFYYKAKRKLLDKATQLINDFNLLKSTKPNYYRSLICKEVQKVFKPQVEVNKRLGGLGFKLTFEQEQRLSSYPDQVLAKAIQKLSTAKARDPVALLTHFCKQIDSHPDAVEKLYTRDSNSKSVNILEKPRNGKSETINPIYKTGPEPVIPKTHKIYSVQQKIDLRKRLLDNNLLLENRAKLDKISIEHMRFIIEEELIELGNEHK